MQLRTTFKTLAVSLSLSLLLFGCAQPPTGPELKPEIRVTLDPGCSTFYVSNLSSSTLGSITVVGSSGQQSMTVGGTGSYDSTTVCFTPDAVQIGGISCPYPNATSVTLPTGAVSISWTSNYLIAVKDLDEQS